MADLRTEKRLNAVENKVTSIETKVDMFIGEMRQQNQMRAAEIREIRESINGMGNRIDDNCRNCHFHCLEIIFGGKKNARGDKKFAEQRIQSLRRFDGQRARTL